MGEKACKMLLYSQEYDINDQKEGQMCYGKWLPGWVVQESFIEKDVFEQVRITVGKEGKKKKKSELEDQISAILFRLL